MTVRSISGATSVYTAMPRSAAMLFGRIAMAAIFLWGGYGKLMAPTATMAAFVHLGLPAPFLAYLAAVVVELGGGVLILVGGLTRWAAIVLAVWCIATALAAHSNFADRNMEIHFFKNVAMMGGFAYIAAVGAGAFSLDALARRRGMPADPLSLDRAA
jgi:putative oxidoreductase